MADQNSHKTEHRKFLETRSQQLITPDEIIDQVVLQILKSQLKDKSRVIAGEINEVYELSLESGQTVIVRIFHGEEDEFGVEEWPIAEAAKVGVPVPKVLGRQTVEIDGQPRFFCLQQKLIGQTVDKRPKMSPDQDREYLHQFTVKAGAMLSKIHQVTPSGFGPISPTGQTKYPTLTEMLAYGYEFEKYKQALTKIPARTEIVDQAKAILDKHHDLLEKTKPHLIHGDFGPKHILMENMEVTGIIDFGNAHGGDPVQEFVGWDIFYTPETSIEWLMEGYENKELFNDEFKVRLELHRIIRTLNLIRYYGEADRLTLVSRMYEQLQKGVNFFEDVISK